MSQCPVSLVRQVQFGSWRIAATSPESRWLPIGHAMEVARCSASGRFKTAGDHHLAASRTGLRGSPSSS